MRIFLAFGYNERDSWIKDLVFPILEAFAAETVTGEDMQGDLITDEVRDRIRSCTGMLGFRTRRQELANGTWDSHRWVSDELAAAIALGVRAVEVRQTGVDPQGGLAGDRQWVSYDESKRDQCLVEIVKTLGRWGRGLSIDLQLLPQEAARQIRPLLARPGSRCTYKLVQGHWEPPDREAPIRPTPSGLVVHIPELPVDALVQVRVSAGGKSWTSDFVGVKSLGVTLQEDM